MDEGLILKQDLAPSKKNVGLEIHNEETMSGRQTQLAPLQNAKWLVKAVVITLFTLLFILFYQSDQISDL